MNKLKILPAVLAALLTVHPFEAHGETARKAGDAGGRMNVLMIIVDDLNTMVGCLDGPAITPNIDALARRGVLFTEAYAAVPSCNPSRVAMFTGQRPEVTRIFNNSQEFREEPTAKDLVTLPQLLKQNGIATVASGKIFHNRRGSGPEPEALSDPISWTYQADIASGKFFGNNFKEDFLDENREPLWVKKTAGSAAKGKVKQTWAYGPSDVEPTNTLDFNSAEFCAAYLNSDQSDPLVKAAPPIGDQPAFVACGIFRPHIPMIAPRQFFDLYLKKENLSRLELPELPEDDRADLPKGAPRSNQMFTTYFKPFPDEHRNMRHAYLASSSYADAAVGIALDGLEKSGLKDRTIVILCGDHGFQLGEKDQLGKSEAWRKSARTPLIISVPGMAVGVCHDPVSLIDIYPTVLELLGLKPVHPLDGVSLVPLLEDPKADREVPAIVTSAGKGDAICIVKDQWNYISYNKGGEELYDHSKDPGEVTNLLTPERETRENSAVVSELKKFIPEARVTAKESARMRSSE